MLAEKLDYNPDTGEFTWKCKKGKKIRPGQIAGHLSMGCTYIAVEGVVYRAQRLAWFFHYGVWPNGRIDHSDGNKTNNRINNLTIGN